MDYYYVNKNAQSNGDHEVHKLGCAHMPAAGNCLPLGYFQSCHGAVRKAAEHYSQVNGCFFCSYACHTT